MKGKIEVVLNESGTHIEVNVEELGEYDPLFLTHAFGKALRLSAQDYYILSIAEATGALEPGAVYEPANNTEVMYES